MDCIRIQQNEIHMRYCDDLENQDFDIFEVIEYQWYTWYEDQKRKSLYPEHLTTLALMTVK